MNNAAQELRDIVGEKYFLDDPVLLQSYRDTLFPVDIPQPFGVILPENADEVAAIVKTCRRYGIPMVPIGLGAPMNGPTACPDGGLIVEFARMNRIISIDPEECVAVIEPGVTIGQLIKALEPYNLMAQYPNSSPLVSVVASMVSHRATGQYAARYGLSDVFINGVEVILGTGERVVTGSAALDSADWHYRHCFGPDLTGIFIGALGTMGFVTKAAIKLSPIPEKYWGVAIGFDNIRDSVEPIGHIARYQMADYINGQHWYCGATTMEDYPWEITGGKAALPLDYMEAWRERRGLPHVWFHMALGGTEREVEARRLDLTEYLEKENINVLHMENDAWFQVRNVQITGTISTTAARFCRHRGGGWSSLVFLAPIKKWGDILEPLVEKGRELGFDPAYLMKVFGPNGHSSQCRFVISFDKNDPDERARAFAFSKVVAEHAVANGGNVHRQTQHPDVIMAHQPEYYAFLKQIKAVVDPDCLLNPGVLALTPESLGIKKEGDDHDQTR